MLVLGRAIIFKTRGRKTKTWKKKHIPGDSAAVTGIYPPNVFWSRFAFPKGHVFIHHPKKVHGLNHLGSATVSTKNFRRNHGSVEFQKGHIRWKGPLGRIFTLPPQCFLEEHSRKHVQYWSLEMASSEVKRKAASSYHTWIFLVCKISAFW